MNNWFIRHFHILLRERETSRFTGSSYLLIACVIAFLVFEKSIAVLAFSFVAVGNPIAAVIGERWGRRRIRDKSLEGSLAFFLVALIFGLILNMVTEVALVLLLVGVLGATVAEFLSSPPFDNFATPLVSGGLMTLVKLLG